MASPVTRRALRGHICRSSTRYVTISKTYGKQNSHNTVLQPLRSTSSQGLNAQTNSKQRKDSSKLPIDPQILANPCSPACTFDDSDTDIHDDESVSRGDQDNALRLMDVILEKTDLVDSASDEDEDLTLLDTMEAAIKTYDDTDPVHSSAKGFIEYFARINILRISLASKLSEDRFQQDMRSWAPMGNSRDEPTRFIRHCSNKQWGCKYTIPSLRLMRRHIIGCKILSITASTKTFLTCRKPDCGKQCGTPASRKAHERDHEFVRRRCEICQDGQWYESERSWNFHKGKHTDEWHPTTCSVPSCPRGQKPFPTRDAYLQHLRGTHKLNGSDVTRYVPALPNKVPVWGSQKRKCPFSHCDREVISKDSMKRHLMSVSHQLSSEEASAKIENILSGSD